MKKKRKKIIDTVMLGLLMISIGLFLAFVIGKVDLIGIIIIIGFIGAIPKVFLTGHL